MTLGRGRRLGVVLLVVGVLLAVAVAGVLNATLADDDAPAPGPAAQPTATPAPTVSASAAADEPAAVARAFFSAAVHGDCATAERLVTRDYRSGAADCRLGDVPPAFADQVAVEVEEPRLSLDRTRAVVPVRVGFAGGWQEGRLVIVRASGHWKVLRFTAA
ncbi:hypothetical protein [Aeromicrobium sp.]|uniref:hypothetical protein n=1 Tax=Aeromicrobium sp. TaxID=1871063 RepID=UPI00351625CC